MRGPNSPPRKSPSFTEPHPPMFWTHSTLSAHTDVAPSGYSSPPAAEEETLVQRLMNLLVSWSERNDNYLERGNLMSWRWKARCPPTSPLCTWQGNREMKPT